MTDATCNTTAGSTVGTTTAPPSLHGLRALADPTRWAVLELLAHGERCVCDLEESLDAAQSRLSYHLGVLRDAGLVDARRDGRWIYYSLCPGPLTRIAVDLSALSETWKEACQYAGPRSCRPASAGSR